MVFDLFFYCVTVKTINRRNDIICEKFKHERKIDVKTNLPQRVILLFPCTFPASLQQPRQKVTTQEAQKPAL